jgi:hypothetical protein
MTEKKIEEIPADQLSIDPRVQRLLDPVRVRKIADRWNDDMVGILAVSHRKALFMGSPGDVDVAEEFVVLDGQTRYEAFKLVCGEATVAPLTCQVYEGLTLPEEAAIFLEHNDRKAVHVRDRFRLAVTAKEEWAVNIADITAHFGWVAQGFGKADAKHRRYNCIGTVERIYRADDGVALRRTLEVISNSWNGSTDAVSTETIGGIGGLFAKHPEIEPKQVQGLVVKLRHTTPAQFIGEVATAKRHYGTTLGAAAYTHVKGIYNRGRKPENQV